MNSFHHFDFIDDTYSDRLVYDTVEDVLPKLSEGTASAIFIFRYLRHLIYEADLAHVDIYVCDLASTLEEKSCVPLNIGLEIQNIFVNNIENTPYINFEVLENLELNFIKKDMINNIEDH